MEGLELHGYDCDYAVVDRGLAARAVQVAQEERIAALPSQRDYWLEGSDFHRRLVLEALRPGVAAAGLPQVAAFLRERSGDCGYVISALFP